MKIVERIAAQGDVLFRRVDALPAHATRQRRNGPLVVAHSETGHHHVIHSPDVEFYRGADPLVCFLRFECAFVEVAHLRAFHTHETLRLLGGESVATCFEVRRQREHVPEAWKQESAARWREARD
jgi:hypothetical protein